MESMKNRDGFPRLPMGYHQIFPLFRVSSQAATDLDPDDHQAAAPGAHKLGVRLAPLASGGCLRGLTGLHGSPGCAWPARVTGLTMVASTACCEPCHKASSLATTSMRRSSETGTSTFMSAKRTLRATRAPASWHTRATAHVT